MVWAGAGRVRRISSCLFSVGKGKDDEQTETETRDTHMHTGARAHRRTNTNKNRGQPRLKAGTKPCFVIGADNNNLPQSKSPVTKDIDNNTKDAHVPPMLHAKTPRSDADSPV